MHFDMILEIALWTCLIIYSTNYVIGWSLFFKLISINKRTHQILFAAIIINLVLIIFFLKPFTLEFILCLVSLSMMIILPFGKKGDLFHKVISSTGFVLYIILFSSII